MGPAGLSSDPEIFTRNIATAETGQRVVDTGLGYMLSDPLLDGALNNIVSEPEIMKSRFESRHNSN